jgi:T-complex protein 1 subunit theta
VYSCAVDSTHTETKGTVLINNADELKALSRGDEELLESQIKAIADAGVTCVVSGGGKFGDLAIHYLNKYKIMAVRLLSKHDLRRLCRAIGATPLPRLTQPTPQEIGHCDDVFVEEFGDTNVTVFRQTDESSAVATIIVRGATDNIMDDIERSIDDGVNVFKLMTKDQRFVPGAGATEIELARRLAAHADTCAGLEQYSIKQFAEAFEVFPYVLAENTGALAKEVVSRLYAAHAKGEVNVGFDNEGEGPSIKDAAAAGIIDNLMTKHWAIKFAAHAAATVLRVDQIIMAKKAGGPKPPKQGPMDRED